MPKLEVTFAVNLSPKHAKKALSEWNAEHGEDMSWSEFQELLENPDILSDYILYSEFDEDNQPCGEDFVAYVLDGIRDLEDDEDSEDDDEDSDDDAEAESAEAKPAPKRAPKVRVIDAEVVKD